MCPELLISPAALIKWIRWAFLFILSLVAASASAQPRINTIMPGSAAIGATVTIQGTGFSATPANNVVYFGPVRAAVTAATNTSLTVKIPNGANHQFVRIIVEGFTTNAAVPFNLVAGNALSANSFSDRYMFATGDSPAGIISADFNGDGKPELVTGNSASGAISVLTNKSTPGIVDFEPAVHFPIHTIQEGVASGDLNGDGKLDLVAASMEQHLVSVFINTSTGSTVSFAPRIDIHTGLNSWPRSVLLFDVDSDGQTDLIVADNNKNFDWNNTNNTYGTVSIHRNTSTGTTLSFAGPVSFNGLDYVRKLAIGDLDNDKKVDFVVSSQVSHGINVFKNNSTPGNIQFVAAPAITTGTHTELPSLGDLNGDGLLDIVVAHLTSGNVSILRNTSSGGIISFAPKQDLPGVSCIGTAIGDVDGDGKPELVVPYYGANKVSVYKNISTGNSISFANALDYESGNSPIEAVIGDIDGDGFPDISPTCSTEDKVAVLRMPGAPPVIKEDLGKDTTLCYGDSLLLRATTTGADFKWSNGASTALIWVKETGNYWVEATLGSAIVSDTIAVRFNVPPVLDLGGDIEICPTEQKVLRSSVAGAAYQWSNGSQLDSLVAKVPGTYWLQVKQNACTVRDTIIIEQKPSPNFNLGNDTVLCIGANLWVEAYQPDIATYLWQDGSSQSGLQITEPGNYWVKVAGTNGCTNADTIHVLSRSLPTINWGVDTVLCGSSLVLSPHVTDGAVVWWNGATTPTFTITAAGSYALKAHNVCGSVEGEVSVSKGICDLYMPNAFTPNGDGKNDVFRVKNTQFFKTFQLKVYNRWGQLLFTTTTANEGWDGSYLKKHQSGGNYIWTVQLTDSNGLQKNFKGNVILIR